MEDAEKPVDLELAIRGNPNTLADPVPRHFLSLLSKDEPKPFKQGSGRLELADDILAQPIAMRVIVNRIWKGHFGTGIVDTPSNFGIGGERPTNPELLDYLAAQFVKDGMSIKKLHRTIMLSATYQLSADNDAANFAKDSGDRLYWRVERKRMDAEQIRDAVLMVAGNLDNALVWPEPGSVAGVHAPHGVREGEPLQAGRISAVVRFSESEHQRGETFHDDGSAAAAVPDEQRFHAGGIGGDGEARCDGAG